MKFTEEQMKSFDMQKWYDLSGQVAIVTGGASGLGLAITHCLISAGATVYVVGTRGYDEVKADLESTFWSTMRAITAKSTYGT